MLEFPGSVEGPWKRYVVDESSSDESSLGESSPTAASSRAAGDGIGTVRYPRLVPRDDECAKQLKQRTLTNLYNQRPTWLTNAHRRLDETVFAAYGWDAGVGDDELLGLLLALNLERADS